jgi:two-component system response regulator AtoC
MNTSEIAPTILIADDEREVLGCFEMVVKCLGYTVETAQDGDEALRRLRSSEREIAAVLLDLMMPNRDGFDTLSEIRSFNPTIPVIVISGAATPKNVVAAIQRGAADFLSKPVAHEDLRQSLTTAIRSRELTVGELPNRRAAKSIGTACPAFVGTSVAMKKIQETIGQIGWSEAPVLIQGETGTGKEVLARELHARSPRADNAFLKLNCAALPSELVESELFGYERGAFTGAVQKKPGMFEMADGGTILLDEIGDMDLRLQAKLLHVLQDQEFRRIGGKETTKVDVRVIAATHQNLENCIAQNKFREDLYYRLSVVKILVPALRDRKEDIVPLAEFLVKRYAVKGLEPAQLSASLRNVLTTYHWPGNVRELENVIRKLTILRDGDNIAGELNAKSHGKTLPFPQSGIAETSAPAARKPPVLQEVGQAKREAETAAILAALHSTRWNRKRAAAQLQIDYKALLYKMKKLGIDEQPQPSETESAVSLKSLASSSGR